MPCFAHPLESREQQQRQQLLEIAPDVALSDINGENACPSPFISGRSDDGPSQQRVPDTGMAEIPPAANADLGLLPATHVTGADNQGDMAPATSVSAMPGLDAHGSPSSQSVSTSPASRVAQPTYAFIDGPIIPRKDGMDHIGEDSIGQYANLYFRYIQPQWPFLNERAWRDLFGLWKQESIYGQLKAHQQFMLRMVIAIGAVLCSYSQLDGVHFSHASKIHEGVIQNHFGYVLAHPSALAKTQSALLLLVYYLHGPSPSSIYNTLNLMLMQCSILMTEHERNEALGARPRGYVYAEQQMRRHTIMSCHIINEVISSAWTYPESPTHNFLDEKVRRNNSFSLASLA